LGVSLNEILFNFEKREGPTKLQSVLDVFKETINVCDLFDLGYSGDKFTWWNRQDPDDSIKESFYRLFLTHIYWSTLLPDAKVTHIDEDFWDRLSIILNVFESHKSRMRRLKNFWALYAQCKDVVNDAWRYDLELDPTLHCMGKVKRCMENLTAPT